MGIESPLTTGQIADYCHVSNMAVLKWIKAGKLEAYTTPGGHYRIQKTDFREFLEEYGMPVYEEYFSGNPGKRILVVDDEPDVVEFIINVLSQMDESYEFASAADGYEAGLKVATFKPDLIILDIMMAGVNGFEVCRRIKTDPETEHVKILVVTGFPEDNNIERMLEYGAEDYLVKPFQIEELEQKVRKLISR